MKRLMLVRHAKASWRHFSGSDYKRPINTLGKSDANLIGQYLYKNNYCPSYIISSHATRTLETSKILIQKLQYNKEIETQPSIYNGNVQSILQLIYNVNDKHESIMLIGHNPIITELANHISNVKIDYMPTCATIIIDFNVIWKEIKNNNGVLVDFIWPKKLK